jgi:hypothetical protein
VAPGMLRIEEVGLSLMELAAEALRPKCVNQTKEGTRRSRSVLSRQDLSPGWVWAEQPQSCINCHRG